MTNRSDKSRELQASRDRRVSRSDLDRLMREYKLPSKGKTLSGHFSPAEAVELLETAADRGRSISEVMTRAVVLGLPIVRQRFPPLTNNDQSRRGQVHNTHIITPSLARLMKKWNILQKGKTLSGHFGPEEAIDVLETARNRSMSTGRILKEAVRIGLPEVKKVLKPVRGRPH